MTKQTIEDALTRSNPWTTPEEPGLRAELSAFVTQSRVAASADRKRKLRRQLWLVPIAGAGVLALTAGAIVADNLLHADLPITIEYTTDTGVEVACTVQIEGGSLFAPQSDRVIEYFRTHDFTGIGQRVYDYALVMAGDREPDPSVFPESSIAVPEGEGYSDRGAFMFSLTSFILTDPQIALDINGSGGAWYTSDCTGQLH
jgi:hypothetical protein